MGGDAQGFVIAYLWLKLTSKTNAAKLNFRRITLFCLEKRLSKHKMTIF